MKSLKILKILKENDISLSELTDFVNPDMFEILLLSFDYRCSLTKLIEVIENIDIENKSINNIREYLEENTNLLE